MTPTIYTALFDAIHSAIESAYYDDTTTIHDYAHVATTAAMKACRPRELVWEGLDMHMTAESNNGTYTIDRGYRPDKSIWCGWIFQIYDDGQSTYFNGFDADTIEAAKAAAQSHADAAHWYNTVIGSETT